MKNRFITFMGAALMLSAVALVWRPLLTSLAVDSCLDAGGSFNYAAGACDFEDAHPFAPTDHKVRFVVAVALALVGVALAIVGRYVRRAP